MVGVNGGTQKIKSLFQVEKVSEAKTVAAVEAGGRKQRMDINFQVADVKRPLLAVKRMAENGNKVVFSAKENYIENIKSGAKLNLGTCNISNCIANPGNNNDNNGNNNSNDNETLIQ